MARAVQILLPISEQQQARKIAIKNVRLLNCWLGIATREDLGNTFCSKCKYLGTCRGMYKLFDGAMGMHPSSRARTVMKKFGIESEYL